MNINITNKINEQHLLAQELIPNTAALSHFIENLPISQEEQETLNTLSEKLLKSIAAQGFLSGLHVGKEYMRIEAAKSTHP